MVGSLFRAVVSKGLVRTAAAAAALVVAAGAEAQPNIVLVVTDDQRWDTLPFMPTVRSELVGKGVHFTNAYAVNPLCCPARASILTGLYSHSHGVWANAANRKHGGLRVFDESSTLPVWLDAAGYETRLVGKYLNGYSPAVPPYVPPGWDSWFAYYGGGGYFDYRITDGTDVRVFGDAEDDYSTDVFAGEAVRFVRNAPEPFFLYLAPFAPHKTDGLSVTMAPRHVDAFAGVPYSPPPSVGEADVRDKPRAVRRRARDHYAPEQLTEIREEQLEALLAVDEMVAEILDALEESGRLSDTIVLFTSDNGHTWGEHRWVGKRMPYEESIRIPLVVRWDALGQPARTDERAVLNVDFAPTLAAVAGAEAPRTDGRSFLPLLTAEPTRWRRSFVFEYYDAPFFVPYCGIRTERWKYVQYRSGEEELYDLVRDPYELDSLHRRTGVVVDFRRRIRRSACRPPGFTPLSLCTLTGTDRADRLRGTRRPDWVCGGRGADVIRVRGGDRDVVRCGRGRDVVYADRRDAVRPGCESVRRPPLVSGSGL